MDEIEAQILSVIESSEEGLEVAHVVKEIESRYNKSYNSKRIRHKMDSLCNFKYLDKETYRIQGMRGPDRYRYSIHREEC